MTKTVLTILITAYSLARLAIVAILYYYSAMRLPLGVVVVTIVCAVSMLIITGRCYLMQLSGKKLRFALFLGATAAIVNTVLILLEQPGTLSYTELVITGTVFDVLFFLGSCTIKIRDTRGNAGRSPFARLAQQRKRP